MNYIMFAIYTNDFVEKDLKILFSPKNIVIKFELFKKVGFSLFLPPPSQNALWLRFR